MNKSLFTFSATLCVFTGCQENKKEPVAASGTHADSVVISATKPEPAPEISITSFKGLPEEINGCACYFSAAETAYRNEEYIFAANYDSVGFVSVNNKLERLKLLTTQRVPGTFGNHDRVEVYAGQNFTVTVDIKYIKAKAEEVWWNKGTITIESAKGGKTSKQFVGECGC